MGIPKRVKIEIMGSVRLELTSRALSVEFGRFFALYPPKKPVGQTVKLENGHSTVEVQACLFECLCLGVAHWAILGLI